MVWWACVWLRGAKTARQFRRAIPWETAEILFLYAGRENSLEEVLLPKLSACSYQTSLQLGLHCIKSILIMFRASLAIS